MVPMLFGSVVAAGILGMPGWIGAKGLPWQFVVGIGMACAVTALPILILLMEKLEILRAPIGQRLLRYASIDDIAIWGVLALVLMDWERIGRQVAFLAGVVMDAEWFDQEQMDSLRHHVLLVMMPVFFLSTGLKTSWSVGGYAVFVVAAALLFAAVTGKLAGVHLAGRVLGWKPGEASLIGWLLQTKALIMIIFVSILLDKEIISSGMFTALLLMAIASTMLTVPMVTPKLRRLAYLRPG